jgi:hypothetical protein
MGLTEFFRSGPFGLMGDLFSLGGNEPAHSCLPPHIINQIQGTLHNAGPLMDAGKSAASSVGGAALSVGGAASSVEQAAPLVGEAASSVEQAAPSVGKAAAGVGAAASWFQFASALSGVAAVTAAATSAVKVYHGAKAQSHLQQISEEVAEDFKALNASMKISAALKHQEVFAQFVYDRLEMRCGQEAAKNQFSENKTDSMFLIYHPSDDWHGSFERIMQQHWRDQSTGAPGYMPGLAQYTCCLGKIPYLYRTLREAHGKDLHIHVMLPTMLPYVVPTPIKVPHNVYLESNTGPDGSPLVTIELRDWDRTKLLRGIHILCDTGDPARVMDLADGEDSVDEEDSSAGEKDSAGGKKSAGDKETAEENGKDATDEKEKASDNGEGADGKDKPENQDESDDKSAAESKDAAGDKEKADGEEEVVVEKEANGEGKSSSSISKKTVAGLAVAAAVVAV